MGAGSKGGSLRLQWTDRVALVVRSERAIGLLASCGEADAEEEEGDSPADLGQIQRTSQAV